MLTNEARIKIDKRINPIILSLLIVIFNIIPLAVITFAEESIPPIRIITESLGNHVSIHSDLQEQYLNGPLQDIANYADGTAELSRPAYVTLSWNTEIDEAYPFCDYCGGKAQRIRKNIYHLCRGEVYLIDNKTVFVLGGGFSLDKSRRTPGKSWFPQEMPSETEYMNATNNLNKHHNQVDFIVTHTCPYDTVQYLATIADYGVQKKVDDELRLTLFLENIRKNVKYKRWYFGHFHVDRELWRNQTAVFNCMREMETGKIVKQWKPYEVF